MEYSEQDKKKVLQRIANILLLNGGFLGNPGLYTGEMGLVLFFARYARFTQNNLFTEYSIDLIEKIQHSIHQNTAINYNDGLAGIGATIEYLVQNKYFEADTDEVLEDFDKLIFFTYNLSHLQIDEIIGVKYYANWRLSGQSTKKDTIQRIIVSQIENIMHERSVNLNQSHLINKTIPAVFTKTFDHFFDFIVNDNLWRTNLGLLNGLAGWGLSLLTDLDRDDSWYFLLPNILKITL